MRKLNLGLVLMLCFLAFACTEQTNLEDTKPLEEVSGEGFGPTTNGQGQSVTYITIEFGDFVNRDAVYNQYRQAIRIYDRDDCPLSTYRELWEVAQITEAEFLEIFTGSNVQTFTPSNTRSNDPYARDPFGIYIYYDLICTD